MGTMYNGVIEKLREYRERMVSPQRAAHIRRMEEDAVDFSKIHGVNLEKLEISIVAHDLFRDTAQDVLLHIAERWKIQLEAEELAFPILIHGKVAAEFLRRALKVEDREILEAVAYHTSGCPTNSNIVMSLVILDTLEHGREFEGVEEMRKIAKISLMEGYKSVIKNKMIYALHRNLIILSKSVETWNYLQGVKV